MSSSFIFQSTLFALMIHQVHSDVTTEKGTLDSSVTLQPKNPDLEHPVHVILNKGRTLLSTWTDPTMPKTASIQGVIGIVGSSVFLHLPVTDWSDLVQIMWKKDGLLVAELKYPQLESHGGYKNRSEILRNGTLRLDKIQISDCGRYSVQVQDRGGKIIYQRMFDVQVDAKQEMMALVIDPYILLFTIVGILGAVVIVVLGLLIWRFEKCKRRTAHTINLRFRHVSWGPSGYDEDIVESGVGDTNSLEQDENGNPASQEPEATNFSKQEDEGFVKNTKETKVATAASLYIEQPMYLNISTFQDTDGPKSQPMPVCAGNDVVSVTRHCIPLEDVNCVPQDDRDFVLSDFAECSPPDFAKCPLPDFAECSPPDFAECPLPDFAECSSPDFDEYPPPEFDDCDSSDFNDCVPPRLG